MNIAKTPWVVSAPKEAYYVGIDSDNGEGYEIVVWGAQNEWEGVRGPDSDESYLNAQAIVSAVNATYGNSISPDAVKEMYDVLTNYVEWCESMAMWDKVGESYYKAKKVLEKAKL